MNRPAATLFGVLCLCSSALGGTVEFSVAEFDVNKPAPVLLDVTVVGDATYDFADVLLASRVDGVAVTGINFSDEWTSAFSFVAPLDPLKILPPGAGLFSSSTNVTPVGPTLLMGQIVVDLSGLGLTKADAGTQVEVFVATSADLGYPLSQVGKGGLNEEIPGTGIIHVTPDPGTIFLLGLAACCLVRRRQGGYVG